MSSETGGEKRWGLLILSGVGILLAVAWLVVYLVPSTRAMMLDMLFSSLLIFVVIGLLWWVGRRSTDTRAFWWLLTAGCGVGLLGNLAWSVYEVAIGKDLPYFSAVDLLYLLRYLLVFLTFWRYPGRARPCLAMPWRWAGTVVVALAATAMVWFVLFRPALGPQAITPAHLLDFLTAASYPVLDAVVLYAAVWAWACAAGNKRNGVGLLTLAMVAYGVANWFNFRGVILLAPPSELPGFFWPLSDILAGVAAGYVLWRKAPQPECVGG